MSATTTIRTEPEWDELDHVREGSEAFLVAQGVDTDSVHAMVMTACELAENAVKYGAFAKGTKVEVTLTVTDGELIVEVRSPLAEESDDQLDRLDEMIQWIRGFQDPHQAYLERLKEVSEEDLEHEESGLGLVRIAYEGQATLDFYIDDTQSVAVSAVRERVTA